MTSQARRLLSPPTCTGPPKSPRPENCGPSSEPISTGNKLSVWQRKAEMSSIEQQVRNLCSARDPAEGRRGPRQQGARQVRVEEEKKGCSEAGESWWKDHCQPQGEDQGEDRKGRSWTRGPIRSVRGRSMRRAAQDRNSSLAQGEPRAPGKNKDIVQSIAPFLCSEQEHLLPGV